MAFTSFKDIGQVAKAYQLTVSRANFLPIYSGKKAPKVLHADIDFALTRGMFRVSEMAICEQLIYPVLKNLWADFDKLLLWSHPTWVVDEQLTGVPEYLITHTTVYGDAVLGPPILVAVEAKKDNFEEGWGQCAAEMVAAQKLNDTPTQPVYGIVSNGRLWELAKLQEGNLTKSITYLDIQDLDNLYDTLWHLLNGQIPQTE